MDGAAGSSNNNNNNNNNDSTTTERKQVELHFAREFVQAMKKKRQSMSITDWSFDKQELLTLRQMFYDEKTAFLLGGGFGVLNFVTLRFYRKNMYQFLSKRIAARKNQVHNPAGKGGGDKPTHSFNSPIEQQQGSKTTRGLSESEQLSKVDKLGLQQPWSSPISLVLDILMSLIGAVLVTERLVDVNNVTYKLSQLPLTIKEKSVFCDEFCPVVMAELEKKIQILSDPKFTTEQKELVADCLSNPQNTNLKNFLLLAENCNKRRAAASRDDYDPDSLFGGSEQQNSMEDSAWADSLVTDFSDDGNKK